MAHSHSRRSSRSRASISGPSGDPFNDASFLESASSTGDAYTSSEDDATPVAARRTTNELPPGAQLTIPYPVVLPPSSSRHSSHQRNHSSSSEASYTAPSPRRGSVAPPSRRQGSVSVHRPPPVSMQTRRRQSLAVPGHRVTLSDASEAVPSLRPPHSSDEYTSSEQEACWTDRPSDISDNVSIASGNVDDHLPEGDGGVAFEDPFLTPRKGSRSEQKGPDTKEAPTGTHNDEEGSSASNNRQSTMTVINNRLSTITAADNRLSTRSSLQSPRAPRRQPRRESDDIDPTTSPSKAALRYSPTKKKLEQQQRQGQNGQQLGHRRNFSRPFSSASESGSLEEEDVDAITELPRINPDRRVTFDPLFDPSFTFGDGRRESQSLQAGAQEKAQEQAKGEVRDLYKEKGLERRKSSTVLVNRRRSTYTIEEEKVVRAVGKERLKWTKWAFCTFFFFANAGCIVIAWMFEEYWWVFAPVILLGNVLNTMMVLNLTRYWIWRELKKLCGFAKPPVEPTVPTTIAMVLACYCENYDELMATLESLHAQERIEQHKKMFLVIVDGQVKGKGMSKTTDRILVEDIFKPEKEEWFPVGYESWDGAINGIYACSGVWRDVPYVCLVKKRNLGKRDGLILVRTLLYKYQFRYDNQESSMGDEFFRWFCEFSEDLGIEKYEWLVGVDADTTFNTLCIYEMHYKCIQDPRLIGCSGLIQVGFRTGNWNLWNLYQNAEYIRAQCLRRMHQAKGTGKVSCLPGACQIIKICEETCGDKILIDTFGHLPDPKDNMIHQVRALAGEDRNYICIIFKHYPKAITTMAMKAIAFTDPPNGLMVFLSQRKRWTLSTNANDMLITSKNAMNWFERICSLADMLVWILPIFVAQTLILFIKACIHATTPVFILSFASVTIVPMIYGLVVTYWGCNGWREKLQYLAGFAMVVLIGQMVTPVVIVYAIWHMDNFSWGKTREVEDDGTGNSKPAHSD